MDKDTINTKVPYADVTWLQTVSSAGFHETRLLGKLIKLMVPDLILDKENGKVGDYGKLNSYWRRLVDSSLTLFSQG